MSSGQRISGRNFDVALGDLTLTVDKTTLSISDSLEVAKNNGIPNGWVSGEVGAEGELELDALGLAILSEAARAAGSWQELPEFDQLFYAKSGSGEELKVEAFGCKFKIESLLEIDKNKGGEKHMTKLKYLVTSPDFVHINGVPYLPPADSAAVIRPGTGTNTGSFNANALRA